MTENETKYEGVIYRCRCLINNKSYIGLTTTGLDIRKARHRSESQNKNAPLYNSYFKYALRKHGWENFEWTILETVTRESNDEMQNVLCEREVYWIDHYNTFGEGGYNQSAGGQGASGYKHTDESRRKLSESRKGDKNPMYGVTGENHPKYGISPSNEVREKIRSKLIGIPLKEETKQKISKKLRGRLSLRKLKKNSEVRIILSMAKNIQKNLYKK